MDRQLAAFTGLAILLVLLNHSIAQGTLGAQDLGYPQVQGMGRYLLLVLSQLGIFAVPIFLYTAGCFISYAARRTPPRLPWKNVWVTLKRILWPYVFWSIMFFISIYIRRNEEYTIFGYFKNLVVGYPFHFIPILLFYYLASPLLVRLADRFGYTLVLIIGVYQVLQIGLVFPYVFGLHFPGWMQVFVLPVLGTTMALWGIYFPLGLVYSLKAKKTRPWLYKFRFVFLITTAVCFVIHILHKASVLHFPLAGFVCPLTFMFIVPTIKRDSIPMFRRLENISKKVYGLYLTHLMVLDLVFLLLEVTVPWLFSYQVSLSLFLFFAAVGVPLVMMNGVARMPTRTVYRYVFG